MPLYTLCCHILMALNLLSAINDINARPWTDSEAGGWPQWSPKGAWGSRLETWGSYLPLPETQKQVLGRPWQVKAAVPNPSWGYRHVF